MMHGWNWDQYGMPIGMMWFGGMVWLISLIVIVSLAVYAIRHFTAARRRHKPALEVLEQAYARGDIKRDEFLQKRSDLLSA